MALKLAHDVESVATPLLSFSPVFTDEDLVEIIRFAGPVRQIAIAKRASLTETVTSAIVEHGAEAAVSVACANDNAAFAEQSLQRAVSRFASSQDVLAAWPIAGCCRWRCPSAWSTWSATRCATT